MTLTFANGAKVRRCDFTALDTIMSHPDYAAQHYVCILNPSETTLDTVRALLAEAYDLAFRRRTKRQTRQ